MSLGYVVAAYIVIIGAIVIYAWSVLSRCAEARRELRALEEEGSRPAGMSSSVTGGGGAG